MPLNAKKECLQFGNHFAENICKLKLLIYLNEQNATRNKLNACKCKFRMGKEKKNPKTNGWNCWHKL